MGYQALLFCPDEKLARVVNQVFTELDFTLEAVQEPFAAVKKLMAQRFDAIVVDCDNEQNASLLFKSARNSSSNQNSLAIAVVEGQAGVAKAYRIGANLVLTKPINVEQAKGTLRVARGLLRKNSDAAGVTAPGSAPVAAPAKTPAATSGSSFQQVNRQVPASVPPVRPSELTDDVLELDEPLQTAPPAELPAMAASAKIEDKPVLVPAPAAQGGQQAQLLKNSDPTGATAKGDTAADLFAVLTPTHSTASPLASAPGSAAAAAPAREVAAPLAKEKEKENKIVEMVPASPSHSGPTFGSVNTSSAPSFGTLNEEDSGGSGSKKKIFIAVAAVAAFAIIGYMGFSRFGKTAASNPAPQSVNTQQSSVPSAPLTSAPAAVPSPSSGVASLATSTSPASGSKATLTPAAAKPSGSAGSPPVLRIDARSEPATQKPASTPMQVKASGVASRKQVQGQADDSAPALPSALAGASANDSLSGLMPAESNIARPTLATLKISQGVSQGLVIKRVTPKYPASALAVHTQGAVLIEATINKEGAVTNVKLLSGDPILARAALEAVRQWRYKPYYLDGDPVEIQTQITVNFKAN